MTKAGEPAGLWAEQAVRYIHPLLTVSRRTIRALQHGDEGATGIDQVDSHALELQHWVGDHLGPDPALGHHLEMLAGRYRFACLTAQAPSTGTDQSNGSSAAARLDILNREISQLIEGLDDSDAR